MVLWCTVWCCCVLYGVVVYCMVLWCTVWCCCVLYGVVVYCMVLWCTVWCCVVLYGALYGVVVYCTMLWCTVWRCGVLKRSPGLRESEKARTVCCSRAPCRRTKNFQLKPFFPRPSPCKSSFKPHAAFPRLFIGLRGQNNRCHVPIGHWRSCAPI